MITDDPRKGLTIKMPNRTPQSCWTREEVEHIHLAARSPHREPLTLLADSRARVGVACVIKAECVRHTCRIIMCGERNPSRASKRHQIDSAFHFPELRSVPFTSSRWPFCFQLAADATVASKQTARLALRH